MLAPRAISQSALCPSHSASIKSIELLKSEPDVREFDEHDDQFVQKESNDIVLKKRSFHDDQSQKFSFSKSHSTVNDELKRANPILRQLLSYNPIFHEVPFNAKLLSLTSMYIAKSVMMHVEQESQRNSRTLTDLIPLPSSTFILPCLGRPVTDCSIPQLCYPLWVPSNYYNVQSMKKLSSSIEAIFKAVVKKIPLFEVDFVLLLCILDRLFREGASRGLTITVENATMIVAVCMMIVDKYSCDRFHLNSFWSSLFSIPLKTLNQSEIVFLIALDYRVTFEWSATRFFSQLSSREQMRNKHPIFDENDQFDMFLAFFAEYTSKWHL
ncbi:uncharacterized protein MONOS_17865 [Monocercomonoides exilis]|uniref:uncharacterized protein n=1 Tax=Monocercomonoides exilis TaxID=2049356 RepID=UPI003559486F|nr:hypothetical protein MONOS_17865 [Monocercomonoides exilis]